MPIINDTLDDGNRTVLLALSNPIGGAVLGANSSATLTIANNDILNVRGLYAVGNTPGVSTVTLKSCSAPVNDGTFQVTGSLNITTQSGRTFSGNGTLDYFNPGLGPTVRLRVPLKATVGSGGAISGTYNFNVTQPAATDRSPRRWRWIP